MQICQRRGKISSYNMPLVSIVVLNWNGKHFLKDCLNSLQKVIYKNLEIIVVDNASSDGSVEFIKKNYPEVKVIKNKENYGFAKGNNIGFKASKGKYILILNNDTIITSNFFDSLVEDFEKDSQIACLQPQIRLLDNKNLLDGVGAFLTPTGFLYHFGYLKDKSKLKYNKKISIFSAKGACIFLRREVIEKIGLFDEDFFIFFEETDLCFRIWLAGYVVVYEPKSIMYHVGGGDTTSSNSFQHEKRLYLSIRNMFYSYVKNFGTRNLLTILPIFIFLNIFLVFYYLINLKINLLLSVCKAFTWNIKNLRVILKKRSYVQHNIRKISDSNLNKLILNNPKINYYYYLLVGKLINYQD